MGFVLRLFGILVTALALLGTAHHFGWLTLGDVLTPFAEGYVAFVTAGLFYPAAALSEQWPSFAIAPHEALIVTLAAILLLGPATLGPLYFDHEFRDAGPVGPFIVRLVAFFMTLALLGLAAGFLPSPVTTAGFGTAIIAVAAICIGTFFWNLGQSIHHRWTRAAFFARKGASMAKEKRADEQERELEDEFDLDEEDEPDETRSAARRRKPPPLLNGPGRHFVGKNFLIFLLAVGLLIVFDRYATLEDDCLKLAGRCLMAVETPEKSAEDGRSPVTPEQ